MTSRTYWYPQEIPEITGDLIDLAIAYWCELDASPDSKTLSGQVYVIENAASWDWEDTLGGSEKGDIIENQIREGLKREKLRSNRDPYLEDDKHPRRDDDGNLWYWDEYEKMWRSGSRQRPTLEAIKSSNISFAS